MSASQRLFAVMRVRAVSEIVIRERFSTDPWEAMSLLRTESVEPCTVLLDRDAASGTP